MAAPNRGQAFLFAICLAGLLLAPAARAAPARIDASTIAPAIRPPDERERARLDQITGDIQSAIRERRWADAVTLGREALAIEEATSGPDHPEVAGTLGLISGWLAEQDKYAEAEPALRRSLAIFETNLGDDHALALAAASRLGANLQAQGRFAEAEPIYRRIVAANLKTYGPNHRRVALSYNNLGFNLSRQGRFREAKRVYHEARKAALSALGEQDLDLALIENNVASNLDALGQSFEAEPLYRRSLAIRLAALDENDPQIATSYNNLGYNLNALGRYADAEPAYRKALEIRVRLNPRGSSTATSYNNVAHNLNVRGDYAAAAPLYAKALSIWEQIYGPDHPVTAIGYSNVAVNLERQGKLAEAVPLFERALKIRVGKLGVDHPDVATSRIRLAHAFGRLERYDLALPLYEQAIEARRRLLGPLHPDLAQGLIDQAELLTDMGTAQLPQALAAAREAMAIVRQRHESRLEGETGGSADAVQQTLAQVAGEEMGHADPLAKAFVVFAKAAWLRSKDVPRETKALVAEAFKAVQDLDTSVAAKTMAQTAARTAAGTGELADHVRRQQDLSSRAAETDAQLLAALTVGNAAEVARLRSEQLAIGSALVEVNRRLRRDFPDYADLVRPRALSVADTQARLKDDEGVLMILSAGEDVYSFALRDDQIAWSRSTGSAGRITGAVGSLLCQVDPDTCRADVTDRDLDAGSPAGSSFVAKGYAAFDRDAAYGLYRDFIAPVETAIRDRKTLYVVTAGALAGLPLGLLPVTPPASGEDGADPDVLARTNWFGDRYALISLPSVSVLRVLRRTPAAGKARTAFIGYGAPTLTGPTEGDGVAQFVRPFKPFGEDGIALADPHALRALAPLPGTSVELLAMAGAMKGSGDEVYLGARATEASVRSNPMLARSHIIAFATHGLLPGELRGFDEPGLVFTPPDSPSTADDGLLAASEVSTMKLSADWIILSACNTASADGKLGADSLSSLARSFLYAGASALLASHWRVADEPTAALTVETLRASKSLSRAEALRSAMRAVRTGKRADGSALPNWNDAWAHPGAWAPFTVISGDN